VLVKAEPLQKGNAFKYRGARNRLSQLSSEQCNTGVVAFSSGNHAIGVAISAKELSIPAIIVMPEDAPKVKIEKVLSYGAEIRFYDRLKESREDIASEISKTSGRVLVPSYDDVHIISGQGTIGIEIAEQAPDAASVIVCLGGGGMCAGISLALGELRPEMNIYGAEPVDYNDHQLSLARNERVKLIHSPPSICDAIMTPQPGELTWSVNSKFLSAVFTASDDDCLKAMALVKRELDLTVEPGGAVAIASLMAQKPFPLDQTVVALASGGNVDENMLQFALDRY
jgi:threonine dehydratase